MSGNGPALVLLRLWFAVGLAGCAVLLYACLMPNPPSPGISNFDKVEHFAAFAVLGTWFGGILAPRYWAVLFGLLGFGLLIEFIQSGIDYRSGDPLDFLADSLGVVAGLGLARLGAMGWLRYIDARVAANGNRSG